MKNNQRGAVNIVLVVLVVVVALGYFAFRNGSNIPDKVEGTAPETELLSRLINDWSSVQALIPIRPNHHNQIENEKKIWRSPSAVQFLKTNNILVRLEDDNDVHAAVFSFTNNKFDLVEFFKSQGEFSEADWQKLVDKYSEFSYKITTYARDLVRNKEIVSFDNLTYVPENIFVQGYYNTSDSDETANTILNKICEQETAEVSISKCGDFYSTYPIGFIEDAATEIFDKNGTRIDFCGGYRAFSSEKAREETEQKCSTYLKDCVRVIKSCSSISNQPASIKIIQPSENEDWSIGYMEKIKWEAQNIPQNSVLVIFLETEKSRLGAVRVKEINRIPSGGEYNLKVPAGTIIYGDVGYNFSGKYRLVLKVYDGDPCIDPPMRYECPPESKNVKVIASDRSKAMINVIPLSAQPSQIKVVSPIAGSSVNGDEDYTIKWTGGESKIEINLIEITGTGSNAPLRFEDLPNTGSFAVKFPNKESQYRIVLFDEVGHSARVDDISVIPNHKYCNSNSDCVLFLCGGPFNKEYAKTLPPDLPCTAYYGQKVSCIDQKCTAVK